MCALAAACSSDDDDDNKPPSAVSAKDACLALADTSVDAAEISLPTSGARVESVAFVEAGAEGNGNGEYCEVNGAISPVDPEAPDIKFRANFPTEWNSKALQLGGGGYNGNIPNTKGKVPLGLDTAPTPPALVNTIASQAVSSCDSLDGAEDGLVSNMSACRAQSANLLAELACKGEPAEDCLTDAQITRTIAVYHNGYTLPYSLAGGITDYLGYNSLEGITMQIGSQAEYIEPPPSRPNAHHVNRADQFVKYFITRDPNFNLLTLDIQNPGPWQDRIVELSGAIGATNADWSGFKERGGKVLWVQGLDDPSVSPHENTKLYNAIVEKMGQSAVDQFMRYYLIPGLAHGGGKFSITWDNLAILDDWVDKDIAPPATPVAVDAAAATKGRTRPVCVYPTWPKYKGSGDINSADNFECAAD